MVKKYYQKHKEQLRNEARERYQNLSEEEKKKKHRYHRERNKNISKEKKEEKVGYGKNCYLAHKKCLLS